MTTDLEWAKQAGLRDGLYRKMGEDTVPPERYFAQEFADLEREKLWPHVWQPACRLEEIPNVGDYSEYTVADQSFLIVRASETEIKAYYNHCRHRGNALGNGNGSYRTGQIVCSFHGWRWNLDGTNSKVYGEQGFTPACLAPDRLRLREVRADTALGMVWINQDPDAPTLSEQLREANDFWGPIKLDQMRVRWWRYMKVPANWKLVQEPFMESYHVAQTHPEISGKAGVDRFNPDLNGSSYHLTPQGNGWLDMKAMREGLPAQPFEGTSYVDLSVTSNQALYDGADGNLMQDWQIAIQNELYREQGLREFDYLQAFQQRLYAEAGQRGMELPTPEQGGGGGYGFVFPNLVITASYGNAFIQRTRPDFNDPESTLVEWYAVSLPQREDKIKRPRRVGPLEYEDWGFVLQQDLSNIEKLQRGVKSQGFAETSFSGRYESMILNFHRALETYLDR